MSVMILISNSSSFIYGLEYSIWHFIMQFWEFQIHNLR